MKGGSTVTIRFPAHIFIYARIVRMRKVRWRVLCRWSYFTVILTALVLTYKSLHLENVSKRLLYTASSLILIFNTIYF
jgi:hypothetical protein